MVVPSMVLNATFIKTPSVKNVRYFLSKSENLAQTFRFDELLIGWIVAKPGNSIIQ